MGPILLLGLPGELGLQERDGAQLGREGVHVMLGKVSTCANDDKAASVSVVLEEIGLGAEKSRIDTYILKRPFLVR